jgi:hypothetical protein
MTDNSAGMVVGMAGGAAIATAMNSFNSYIVVEQSEFEQILARCDEPLVITFSGGFFSKKYRYVTDYKGYLFYTKLPHPLDLPPHAEVVQAKSVGILHV